MERKGKGKGRKSRGKERREGRKGGGEEREKGGGRVAPWLLEDGRPW